MKNKRRVLWTLGWLAALGALFSLFLFQVQVYAEGTGDEEQIIEEQSQSNQVKKIEDQLKDISGQDIKEILPDFNPQSIIKDVAKGQFEFNPKGIINRVLSYLSKEIYLNVDILIKLIAITVLCSLLKNLQTSFFSESIGELAFYACYVVVVSILVVSFSTVMNMGRQIIDNMVSFMQATVPVLITLLVSGGNLTSGGIFQPILISMVEISATVIKNVFIPLIFLSTILSIVNNISDKVQISKLSGFIKQISGWALGIILTVFVALVSIQGSLGAVVDGVTSKTAKFAIGAFIPIAGKYLADAADTVVGCTLLIKNAAGVAAMLGIIALCLIPLLKMLAIIILYRFTCVLIEPVSDKRIVSCINDIASAVTHILGIVSAVAFMFLIAITAIISASNVSAMVR